MNTTRTLTQSEFRQLQHTFWQRWRSSASSIATRLIIACRWQTNDYWICSPSILLANLQPSKGSHKVSAYRCLHFQVCFMREYLDPVVNADQCAQNVDGIEITADIDIFLTRCTRAVFKCIG